MTDIKGSLSDSSYTWAEDRPGGGGGGPRSMKIMGPGIAQGGLLWGVEPNPHGNSEYNDGGQAKLYAGFVKQIDQGWPTRAAAKFKPVKSVDDVTDKKQKAELLKLKKDKQEQALKTYNESQKKAEAEQIEDNYRSSVVKHLNGKKGKMSFNFGSETYKLG